MVKRRKPSDEAAAAEPGYAPVVNAGFQATASRVQEMHQAIAGKTFDSLQLLPGLSVPTRIVQGVHDAITQGVYAAVRHGGSAALTLAGGVERFTTDPQRVPGTTEQRLRSALNGAVGDTLAASGSSLSVQMGLHDANGPVLMNGPVPARLRRRVCVFIHGLACDEHSWQLGNDAWATSPWASLLPASTPIRYGALLEREFDVSALYLRYNSGLAIEANAAQWAALMGRLALAAPQVEAWIPIGHSMGGLIARHGHALAAAEGQAWAAAVPTIVCLGSPHQGAPLAKLGHVAAQALAVSDVTRPLARIAETRSRGIRDLRRGLPASAPAAATAARPPALRLLFGTLGDADGGGLGALVGHVLGDGLVRAGSAADDGADVPGGDVQRVELAGLGHMSLLNHPRVYAVLRDWL